VTVAAIIQARMGSTRLPGKVLADLGGAPMLDRVVARVMACPEIGQVVIATSDLPADDALAARARALGVLAYRGSPHDVLDRYAGAAALAGADVIVRVTSDCPLLDPGVIGDIVRALDGATDYASNTHTRSFPRGLDVEALHRDTLVRIARLATSPAAREHVTAFVMERPELFVTRQVVAGRDDSDLRITVDTPEDLAVVREIWAALCGDAGAAIPPYRDVVDFLRRRPDLRALNADVAQKSWRDSEVSHVSAP
jgi:spore coat polysaccharide biosynthesis protein SpsF